MAKTTSKKTAKPKEPAVKKAAPKNLALLSPGDQIEKACYTVLEKLRSLNLDAALQSDIEWCLGSYASDKNPIGLYEMGRRANDVLKAELSKKTKGVTAKLVNDLEKALAAQ